MAVSVSNRRAVILCSANFFSNEVARASGWLSPLCHFAVSSAWVFECLPICLLVRSGPLSIPGLYRDHHHNGRGAEPSRRLGEVAPPESGDGFLLISSGAGNLDLAAGAHLSRRRNTLESDYRRKSNLLTCAY